MFNINVFQSISLLNKTSQVYSGCIFINDNYFLTEPVGKTIDCYNTATLEKTSYSLEKPYHTITHNNINNFFYATITDDYDHIYILDHSFNEIDIIKLVIPDKYLNPIKNIYYHSRSKKIMITTKNHVFSVTEEGYFIKEEIIVDNLEINNHKEYTTDHITTRNGRHTCIAALTNIESICFTASCYFGGVKYISYTKNGSAFIASVSRKGNIIDNIYIDDDVTINSFTDVIGNLQLLITKKGQYNYLYLTDVDYGNHLDFHEDLSDGDIKEKANNILCSMASIEKAIAKILESEANKVTKALEKSEKPADIIKINETTNKVINKVTILEQLLFSKLDLIKSLIEDIKPKDN